MTLTPELDAILDSLVELCYESLCANEQLDTEKRDDLVESLATNGWERHRGANPLWVILRERAVRKHPDPAMHRGAALEKLTRDVEAAYQSFARRETSVPDEQVATG